MQISAGAPGHFLTASQVAERLAVSHATVVRMVDAGTLAGYRLGPRSLRIEAQSVDRLLAETRVPAGQDA